MDEYNQDEVRYLLGSTVDNLINDRVLVNAMARTKLNRYKEVGVSDEKSQEVFPSGAGYAT
jgi:hypothetical protein